MSLYYLMSQLPSLDGLQEGAPLPLTVDDFREVCGRFLEGPPLAVLAGLTLTPERTAEATGSPLVDAWNDHERALRIALATVRAGHMKKSFDASGTVLRAPLVQAAQEALDTGDPLAAERTLGAYRLGYLESIRPLDGFCQDAVYYYGLKLMLLQRMALFDEQRGREAYRNIYDSILHGDDRENEQ